MTKRLNAKDLWTGLIFVAVGLFYLVYAIKTLAIGRALSMGPGYFPIMLSGILIAIGVVVIIRSFILARGARFGVVPWRAIVMLTLAVVVFAAFLNELGMFPAVWVISVLACLSSSRIGIRDAMIAGVAIAAFCTLVFSYGMTLPIPVLGTWFAWLGA